VPRLIGDAELRHQKSPVKSIADILTAYSWRAIRFSASPTKYCVTDSGLLGFSGLDVAGLWMQSFGALSLRLQDRTIGQPIQGEVMILSHPLKASAHALQGR
jgi:hypothetical protein